MSQSMMSVSSLNTKIKSLLEATFMHILVEGEVASVTYHTSGHIYFSIKDQQSSIKCVMWRSSVSKLKFRIEKGMHIVIEGSIGVYTPRGEYQFYAVHVEPYGKGALALAYEQLKERLKEKGYFDAQRKKPIPKHIRKIALVTAKESAALHDMLKIIEHRWPLLEVVIVDTLVQGDEAAAQIAHALHYADSLSVDVVVVGRGGGSAEDLWSFNEEMVADALFTMQTPVVSAVGHEVDVMISDFVADLRAPTPSAAMEMILPDMREILYTLNELVERFTYAMNQKLQHLVRELKHTEEILLRSSPSRQLKETQIEFIRLEEEFKRIMTYKLERFSSLLPEMYTKYRQNLVFILEQKNQYLEYMDKKLKMNDPKLQCRKGWAQISAEEKTIELSAIEVNQKFTVQDAETRIEALCLSKA
ncbi:exodeoxyribonuclease VII large subunit [Sulfurovum sp. XTW-4]|uniref:Exodeoxyribonuclease 7 large subunit n=1 Tax=Sulfurovum xiamenensis TaxID=3019066 RepID=A0ABT7QQZ4_9BACT|nr:exodeoxyribonuclease VII large subunit [Sulfurovum xiamenensis]MDM5262969.1 exodeoxyribonuclease VII large subunit [Sulfurovum xiamenensis]